MPKIIWKGIIVAGIVILLTSCKASEPAESAEDYLYPYLENQEVGFLDSTLEKEIDPQFKFVNNRIWPYTFSIGSRQFFGNDRLHRPTRRYCHRTAV